ncbi:MAG TPA: YbaK/EbsC family protein [Actinomycetota bacterium]|nr:YbaK/EbsC family protein [Actinomycetota bacterium]
MRSSIDVHNHLLADDIPHELSQLSGALRDLSAAPGVLGLDAVTVAKPTVLAGGDGVVLVLAPAEQDVDVALVSELVGREALHPIEPDEAPGLTGYLLPFVPPIALECPVTVVLDEQLAHQDVVYTAAGEPGVILKVRGVDLVKVTSAVVSSVTRTAER